MNNLRKHLIKMQNMIPLTPEESSQGDHEEENPTWLPEHRLESWTHPHSKEFPKGYSFPHQLYGAKICKFEGCWDQYTILEISDMDVRVYYGYNMSDQILAEAPKFVYISMFLPIWQRRIVCFTSTHREEIFDSLGPKYRVFFTKN